MPEYDLKIAVTKLGSKRMNFGFYRGDKDSQILISPMAAPPKLIAEMEKECGTAKRVAKGLVFYDGNQLVFATKEAPAPTWETLLTKVFKERKCAQFLPLVLRQLGESESEEASGDETSSETVPGVTPPTAPGSDALREAWVKYKALMTPRISAAVAANPAAKGALLGLLKEALDHEKAGQFQPALEALQRLAAQLPTAPPPPTATTPPGAPPPPVRTGEEIAAALNRLAPKLKEAVAANPAGKQELLAPVVALQAHLKAGRLAEAAQLLEQLAKKLGGSAPGPSASETPGAAGALDEALAGWSGARAAVLAQLQELEKAIRAMNDPEGDAAIILVKAIQANLSARPATPQAVAELVRYLETDDIIEEAEGPNGFQLKVEIRGPLLPALGKIRAALGAQAA